MKNILIFILSITVFTACAQNEKSLKITIKGYANASIYLLDYFGDNHTVTDTAHTNTNGTAVFKFKKNYPVGMYKVVVNRDSYIDLIYNKENIEIETSYFAIDDSLKIIKSHENKLYYSYLETDLLLRHKLELIEPIVLNYPRDDKFYLTALDKYDKLQDQRNRQIQDSIDKYPQTIFAHLAKSQIKPKVSALLDNQSRANFILTHYFDNIDFSDKVLMRTFVLNNSVIEYLGLYSNRQFSKEQQEKAFIDACNQILPRAMADDDVFEYVLKYLIDGFERYEFNDALKYLAENYSIENCDDGDRKSSLQKRLESFDKFAIGKQVPNIKFNDINGKDISLSGEKDYTLVVFWATWCPHCTEMITELYKYYKENNTFDVIAISLDKEKASWEDYIRKNNLDWINASQLKGWDSPIVDEYAIYATPTMFLIDKDNNILAKPTMLKTLQQEVEKLKSSK